MRVIPQHEVLEKLAAIQRADALGRRFAQDQAMEKLASMAGVFMANTQNEMGMHKLAQSMVFAGELSPTEYEMLKEAGFVGLLAKKVGRSAKTKVTNALTGASQRVAKVKTKLKAPPKPTAQSRDWGTPGNVVPTKTPKVKARSTAQSRDWAGKPPPPPTPRPTTSPRGTNQSRDWGAQPTPPKRPSGPDRRHYAPEVPTPKPAAGAAAAPGAASPGTVTPPAAAPGRATRSGATNPPAPAASPGSVAPAPASAAPTSSTAAYKKGVGWGRALPYMAAGGLGYGLYKGVPWAARQLEATSTTPMASNAGWSPVSYGYGNSPYGPGVATMGGGA